MTKRNKALEKEHARLAAVRETLVDGDARTIPRTQYRILGRRSIDLDHIVG